MYWKICICRPKRCPTSVGASDSNAWRWYENPLVCFRDFYFQLYSWPVLFSKYIFYAIKQSSVNGVVFYKWKVDKTTSEDSSDFIVFVWYLKYTQCISVGDYVCSLVDPIPTLALCNIERLHRSSNILVLLLMSLVYCQTYLSYVYSYIMLVYNRRSTRWLISNKHYIKTVKQDYQNNENISWRISPNTTQPTTTNIHSYFNEY